MSSFLRTLLRWPAGKPFPPGAISLFYDPGTDKEYQLDLTRLGGNGTGGAPFTITPTENAFGIEAGKTYTDVTAESLLRTMLVRFQVPSFTAFAINGQSSQTVLVGTQFPAGSKSITWNTANSQNVVPASLTISDVTGNVTLLTKETNDGTASASTAGFTVKLGESRRYRITGKATQGPDFAAELTITGSFESYFGYVDHNGVLDMATLLSVGGAQLQGGKARTVGGVTAGPGLYTVYAWPSNGSDDIAQVLQDGVDSIRGAFGPVRYATGPNSLGASNTVGYIISNAPRAFTNSSLAFS
jgi:hypothetical protein